MALTSLERVRRKIADRPALRREQAKADGVSQYFKLSNDPILAANVQVWVNESIQTETTDYVVNADDGVITFVSAPAVNDAIVFQYYSVVWTDVDIEDFLSQYGDNVNITSAHVLFAWAADAARLAKRETRSGGGGLGAITQDTSVAARELRATAKALMDWEIEYGAEAGSQVPADGLTEIPWTEAAREQIEDQRFVRDN